MIYIAGPFFNNTQVEVIRQIEDLFKHNQFDYFSPRMFGVLKDLSESERKTVAKEIFDKNIEMIEKSECLVAVIDGFDPGTMIEIGYAFARNKKIITYSPMCYGLNVMLVQMSNGHCIDIEKLKDAIKDPNIGIKLEAAT